MPSHILLMAIGLWYATTVFAVKDINDLFVIDYSSTGYGNCEPFQDDLNDLVAEALHLAQVGSQAIDDYEDATQPTHAHAVRIVNAFFKDPDEDDRESIRVYYDSIADFLNTGPGVTQGGATSEKPYLVCNDDWRIRKDMNSQAQDSSGNLVKKNDGTPFLIQDSQYYVQLQAQADQDLGVQTYPYFSPLLNEYFFDKTDFGTPQPNKGSCDDPNVGGVTYSRNSLGSVVLICPEVFASPPLRSATAEPVPVADFVNDRPPPDTPSQQLESIRSPGSLFFHELLHLVQGIKQTVPQGGEVYNCDDMLADSFTLTQANSNPQTYTDVALGYDYTLNAAEVADQYVEFYTSWCTIQRKP